MRVRICIWRLLSKVSVFPARKSPPKRALSRLRVGSTRLLGRSIRSGRPRPRRKPMSKVLYEKRDRIAYVTINRPEARNAIDPDVHRLMIETWADFRDDDSVDVAILTAEAGGPWAAAGPTA